LSTATGVTPFARRLAGPWILHLICLIFLFDAALFGIDRDRRIEQLYHTVWTLKEGAPGEVRALAQTADGYL
jgi:hypothetical protein